MCKLTMEQGGIVNKRKLYPREVEIINYFCCWKLYMDCLILVYKEGNASEGQGYEERMTLISCNR